VSPNNGTRARTFAVVGEGGFALRCAQAALQRWGSGALRFSASPDGSLAGLAAAHGVPHLAARRELEKTLAEEPIDRLFSLNNPWVIPRSALESVRELAVNYHDSLLPDYAGLHATTWAILDGATTHGITFHEMAAELDAGAILIQRAVPVAPDERAFSLNAKCFEAGIEGFGVALPRFRHRRSTSAGSVGQSSRS
jgi:methionyl-tRNA formyltransferase